MVDAVEDYLAQHKDKPVILCGDFNDTPISYTRHRVASLGLTDAFREAGQGFGFSFRRNAIRGAHRPYLLVPKISSPFKLKLTK